jgi:hypothetical protein
VEPRTMDKRAQVLRILYHIVRISAYNRDSPNEREISHRWRKRALLRLRG